MNNKSAQEISVSVPTRFCFVQVFIQSLILAPNEQDLIHKGNVFT